MADSRSAASRTDVRQWAQESKDKARFLMIKAADIRRSLFSSGDLTGYLNLLSRLHHYDSVNLLLIYDRFPEASCLAGYKLWSRYIQPPGAQILKRQWIGKGIDLVAPFTDAEKGQFKLTWYCVSVFDIAQTNVVQSPAPGIYLQDEEHSAILLHCLREILEYRFHLPILLIRPTEKMMAAGIPGYLVEGKVSALQMREDLTAAETLRWLTEILVRQFLRQDTGPQSAEQLLINCCTYCILRGWGIEDPPPRTPHLAVQLQDGEQLQFLDRLRRTVRAADAIMSAAYREARRSPEEREDENGTEVIPHE